jgi:hypothetical protein
MKCPKCGFESPDKSGECINCGIVFAKFNPRPGKPVKLLMTSKVPCIADGIFAKLFYPVAVAKIYVDSAYRKLLGLIWDELFKGRAELDQTGNFIAFGFFCVLSIVLYHFEYLVPYIVLALAVIWQLDVLIAKHKHRNCSRNDLVRLLKGPQEKFTLKKVSPGGPVDYTTSFSASEVGHIVVSKFDRRGGAFREKVATVWQSSLSFNDGSELLLSEDQALLQAVRKAGYVSKLVGVPFRFKYDQGSEIGAESGRKRKPNDNIKLKSWRDGVKISTKWTSKMRLGFMLQVLKESGFFLFLLVVAGVMIKFGGLLIFLYHRFYGSGMPSVNMEFSFWGILSVFAPDWDVVDVGEYVLALLLIIRKTLLLAQSQAVTIDKDFTRYYRSGTQAGECRTHDIDRICLLANPEPSIIVFNSSSAIEVSNLNSMEDFESFFRKLCQGVERFKVRPNAAAGATPVLNQRSQAKRPGHKNRPSTRPGPRPAGSTELPG